MCLGLSMENERREPFKKEGKCEAQVRVGAWGGDGLAERCKTLGVLLAKAQGKLSGGPREDGEVRHGCELLE